MRRVPFCSSVMIVHRYLGLLQLMLRPPFNDLEFVLVSLKCKTVRFRCLDYLLPMLLIYKKSKNAIQVTLCMKTFSIKVVLFASPLQGDQFDILPELNYCGPPHSINHHNWRL